MDSQKFRKVISWLIAFIFVVFTGVLAVLSVFIHCETNIYDYGRAKSLSTHTVYLYGALAIAGSVAIMFLCSFLERIFSQTGKRDKICRIVYWVCGAVIVLAGMFWIIFHDEEPFYDQLDVYQEAKRIAGFLDEPFDTIYYSTFPRNKGIMLIIAMALKIFGNHLYSFQILNLLAALVIYYSVYKISEILFHNPVITTLTALFLILFYPLIVYITFIYGTMLSIALTSLGLYAAAAWHETGKLRYGIMIAVCFPLGILMHQSAAIGLVAAIMYLLFDGRKKQVFKATLITMLAAGMIFCSMKTADLIYGRITGAYADGNSIPVTCTIYMGLTSTESSGGPGSQDGTCGDIFEANNFDGQAANKDAIQRISTVVREYLTGKRSLRFFLEKTEYQWLDPTFGARKIIRMEGAKEGKMAYVEAFEAFYDSSFRNIIFKLSIGSLILTYSAAFITGVYTIRHRKRYPAVLLVQLYVIGGCTFQMMWESLSRYCLGYYIWLLPMAAAGEYFLYQKIKERLTSNHTLDILQKRVD